MLFIKLKKVKNLTCLKFKHYITNLMLCNKIEKKIKMLYANNINKNKQIRELHANKVERSYTRVAFRELHSEKRHSDDSATLIYQELKNFHHSYRQESRSFKQDFSKLLTRCVNMKKTMKKNILFVTESNRFTLMKSYLLKR